MSSQNESAPASLLKALAEFRHQLRSFLQFSEQAATDHSVRPRQHQLLLQIAGIQDGHLATINYLAERLGLPAEATYGEALAKVAGSGDRALSRDYTRAVLALRDDERVQGRDLA